MAKKTVRKKRSKQPLAIRIIKTVFIVLASLFILAELVGAVVYYVRLVRR